MTEAPESLQVHAAGRRLRAVLRKEREEREIRPFFIGLISFAIVAAFATRASPEVAPYAYILCFLILLFTVPFGVAVINPPLDVNLDDHLLQIGNEETTVKSVRDVTVRADGRIVWLAIEAEQAFRWPLSAASHPVEDVEWLAEQIRLRASNQ